MAFWEDTLRYLYLPRLKDRDVLAQAIRSGAASRDFFGTAYGQHDGSFDGFHLGSGNVQVDDTLLLIEPEAARVYEEKSSARYRRQCRPVQAQGQLLRRTQAAYSSAARNAAKDFPRHG